MLLLVSGGMLLLLLAASASPVANDSIVDETADDAIVAEG